MINYRCPRCNSQHSVGAEKVFDGRLIFRCAKCNICSVVSLSTSTDEAYLDFLDRYESGVGVANVKELLPVLEQEKIIRSSAEIDALMTAAEVTADQLLGEVLHTRQDYVVELKVMNESEPESGSAVEDLPLDGTIIQILKKKGINRLYKFQENAIKKILQGNDVVITAPTAAGKTEAFCIPIAQKVAEGISRSGSVRDEKGRVYALFIYPTKALSRDQLSKITEIVEPIGMRVAILDGDTQEKERKSMIESPPELVITNFDVLHYHMMYRTKLFQKMLTTRFLVVDEAHVYTGVFGANIHYILARFERLAGRKFQIVAASATLPNAAEFCQTLFGRNMQLVQGTGRRGKINLAIIFPTLRSNSSLLLDLLREATKRKFRTIIFSNSHLRSELNAFYGARQGIKIKVHRAGLLPNLRKGIEDEFKRGKLMALSATSTLELGIDIGDVDAVISNIVPITRLTQRVGRAGRRGQQGYAFLALGNDPISQYYKMHPEDYLVDYEWAYTDPKNPFVQEHQILAMICDRPLLKAESSPVEEVVQKLMSKGLVKAVGERFLAEPKLAMRVLNQYNIRGIGTGIKIKHNKKNIGDRALPQALEELHKDAIYFLAGRRYKVQQLHFERGSQLYAEVYLVPNSYPYYTKALTDEWPSILQRYDEKIVFGTKVAYCSLNIQKRVFGFSSIEIGQEVPLGKKFMLDKPLEYEFVTKGFMFRAPKPEDILKKAEDKENVKMGGFHASEHVIIEGSAMITGGASQDLGGISLGSSGLIFVYDGSIGGNGASRTLYNKLDNAFARSLRILSECTCTSESGCPRCTYSYRCGNNNEFLHKHAANEVLDRIIDGERTDLDVELWGDRALI